MPLLHFQRFAGEKSLGLQPGVKAVAEALHQAAVAGEKTRFQHGGLHRDVGGGFVNAICQIAHAGADLQARVPATAYECLDLVFQHFIGFSAGAVRQQHQHIDI